METFPESELLAILGIKLLLPVVFTQMDNRLKPLSVSLAQVVRYFDQIFVTLLN
jgi:hypothetical protein